MQKSLIFILAALLVVLTAKASEPDVVCINKDEERVAAVDSKKFCAKNKDVCVALAKKYAIDWKKYDRILVFTKLDSDEQKKSLEERSVPVFKGEAENGFSYYNDFSGDNEASKPYLVLSVVKNVGYMPGNARFLCSESE